MALRPLPIISKIAVTTFVKFIIDLAGFSLPVGASTIVGLLAGVCFDYMFGWIIDKMLTWIGCYPQYWPDQWCIEIDTNKLHKCRSAREAMRLATDKPDRWETRVDPNTAGKKAAKWFGQQADNMVVEKTGHTRKGIIPHLPANWLANSQQPQAPPALKPAVPPAMKHTNASAWNSAYNEIFDGDISIPEPEALTVSAAKRYLRTYKKKIDETEELIEQHVRSKLDTGEGSQKRVRRTKDHDANYEVQHRIVLYTLKPNNVEHFQRNPFGGYESVIAAGMMTPPRLELAILNTLHPEPYTICSYLRARGYRLDFIPVLSANVQKEDNVLGESLSDRCARRWITESEIQMCLTVV